MRQNLPVTDVEYDYPDHELLMSTTDTKGTITHCNEAFCRTAGFSVDDLIGQPHNIIRHPDMPAEAFRDMWATVGHGRSWTGIVKNRRSNGDYYWVRANVAPIMENGKPTAYMSVRTKPTAEEVQAAQALHAALHAQQAAGRRDFYLHRGAVRYTGVRNWLGKLHRLSLTQRLALMLAGWLGLAWLSGLRADTVGTQAWQLGLLASAAGVILLYVHKVFTRPLAEANRQAHSIMICDLTRPAALSQGRSAIARQNEQLRQVLLNLRAVIGDARVEIGEVGKVSSSLAQDAGRLSRRTEAQASNLQETAASMEQVSAMVAQSMESVRSVLDGSQRSAQLAGAGGLAIAQVGTAMQNIEQSSGQMRQFVEVIEGIAAQTNILSLNAGVEAARAGEQGKGFAIVASEVRALAQRSAAAARQIRALIELSGEQVDQGVRSVAEVQRAIGQVVASVSDVNQLMAELDLATREQTIGIEQVNRAVSELDRLTQQNAAMVDATAASAENLTQNTGVLDRTLAVFRLPA